MSRNTEPGDELYFQSLNDASPVSIVLLHGIFSSHLEWEHVSKQSQLSGYHLIIPDLPQHSQSKHIQPFSLELAADKVASIISKHAHGGQAHVVGLSLGGFVTMELVRRHAGVVRTAFTTGASALTQGQLWLAARPKLVSWGLWLVMQSGFYRLAAWQVQLLPHDELKKEMSANNTVDLAGHAYGDLGRWKEEVGQELGQMDKRMLIAGGDQGDNLAGVKSLARLIKESAQGEGKKTLAFSVDGATHGWDLQFPELFARGIAAWIEEQPQPKGFTPMELD